ncbi:hypothetical protein COOONC_04766 [Cooperia oncophora]
MKTDRLLVMCLFSLPLLITLEVTDIHSAVLLRSTFQSRAQCHFVKEFLRISLTYLTRYSKSSAFVVGSLAQRVRALTLGVHTLWILVANFAQQYALAHPQVSKKESEKVLKANASFNSLFMKLADFHLYGMKEIVLFLRTHMFPYWGETVNFVHRFVNVLAVLYGIGRRDFTFVEKDET